MLRPINKLTRWELKAVWELIENPDDFDKIKERHPIMEETEWRFDKFEE
jgi:hypothetical protein